MGVFDTSEHRARELDAEDSLAPFRERFAIPNGSDGAQAAYFCGNSLGLMPLAARDVIEEELDAWRDHAVAGHFNAARPWFSYHEHLAAPGARLVGALPTEVAFMNALTVNLHLMLISFYQPTRERFRVLMEAPAFPSDRYAVQSHARLHGLDPDDVILEIGPRDGEHTVRMEDIEETLDHEGERVALVLVGGVNFLTGQAFDMPRIVRAARRAGALVGFDLAHAAGNLELRLHDWDADFAVWCTYKYVNAGPGAPGGCFVHRKHGDAVDLLRLAGWWGNDPETRFELHLLRKFIPQPGAAGWQISNPPILSMAPLFASLAMFDEAGMAALREKSVRLTAYMERLLENAPGIANITPRDPHERGCQLSLEVDSAQDRARALAEAGIVVDFRKPNIIRVAPAPLYNRFHDAWRLARALGGV